MHVAGASRCDCPYLSLRSNTFQQKYFNIQAHNNYDCQSSFSFFTVCVCIFFGLAFYYKNASKHLNCIDKYRFSTLFVHGSYLKTNTAGSKWSMDAVILLSTLII